MTFDDYLTILAEKGGSDVYLSTGAPPSAKFHGTLSTLNDLPLPAGAITEMANAIMDEEQREEFAHELEMNLAYSIPQVGRFRVNIFKQRNETSIVARNIVTDLPNPDALGLPAILKDVIMEKMGLVLFVGATGSGKSTSLAALIDHRNTNSGGHIITIEDPIEFVHKHKKSIINQREVGVDTRSYEKALKNTLRQAPDVILIGEIRDRATMEHALAFAETGHLCISTLHANNANQAMDRIINFFPEERHAQLLLDISLNIKGIVSQRLLPTLDGKRCAAIEILLGTPRVKELILKGHIEEIKEVMGKSEYIGMQTFETALFKLIMDGKISEEEGIKNADSANNLRLRLKLARQDLAKANGEVPDVTEEEKETRATPAAAKSSSGFSLSIEDNNDDLEEDDIIPGHSMFGDHN